MGYFETKAEIPERKYVNKAEGTYLHPPKDVSSDMVLYP